MLGILPHPMPCLSGSPGHRSDIQRQQGNQSPPCPGPSAQEELGAHEHSPWPYGLGEQAVQTRPLVDILSLNPQQGPREQEPQSAHQQAQRALEGR